MERARRLLGTTVMPIRRRNVYMAYVMNADGIERREHRGKRRRRYSTRGATVPRVLFTEQRRLGLGALGPPAAGLRPRPAREKGFPSNLLLP